MFNNLMKNDVDFYGDDFTMSENSPSIMKMDEEILGDSIQPVKNKKGMLSDHFDRNFDFIRYAYSIELLPVQDFDSSDQLDDYFGDLIIDLQEYSKAKFELLEEYDTFISMLVEDIKYKTLSNYERTFKMFCENLHIKLCNNLQIDSLREDTDKVSVSVIDLEDKVQSVEFEISKKTNDKLLFIKRSVTSYNYLMSNYGIENETLDLFELIVKFSQKENLNKNKLLKNIQRGQYWKRQLEFPEFNVKKVYEELTDHNGESKEFEIQFIEKEYDKFVKQPFEYLCDWLYLGTKHNFNFRVSSVIRLFIELFFEKLNLPILLVEEMKDILFEDLSHFSSIESTEEFMEQMTDKFCDLFISILHINEGIYLHALDFAEDNGLRWNLAALNVIFMKEKYRFSWNTSKEQFYVALKIPRNKWSEYDLICEQWDKYLEYKYKG